MTPKLAEALSDDTTYVVCVYHATVRPFVRCECRFPLFYTRSAIAFKDMMRSKKSQGDVFKSLLRVERSMLRRNLTVSLHRTQGKHSHRVLQVGGSEVFSRPLGPDTTFSFSPRRRRERRPGRRWRPHHRLTFRVDPNLHLPPRPPLRQPIRRRKGPFRIGTFRRGSLLLPRAHLPRVEHATQVIGRRKLNLKKAKRQKKK